MNCSVSLSRGPLPTVLVVLNQVISMQILHRFPGVVALGITQPFDQVLQFLLSSKIAVRQYSFDFPFGFSFYKIGRRSGIIWTMRFSFDIRSKEGRVEYGMDLPLRR